MKYLIVVLLLLCFMIFCLTGCADTHNYADIDEHTYELSEWVSPDGVHYWTFYGYHRAAVTPRYDADGCLVIDGK